MPISKVPPPKGKGADKRKAAATRRATSTDGAAKRRSVKVADEYAAGQRHIPEEEHDELPPNATPLDIMVMAMRRAYLLGGSIAAAPYAEKAAPYMHAKISSVELKNPTAPAGSADAGRAIPFAIEFVDPAPEEHNPEANDG